MINRRLFVISTIGDLGSKRREHADDVYVNIIEAAVAQLNHEGLDKAGDIKIEVIRGERDLNLRSVIGRIVQAILDADLIAVVAFEPNGNVFYEAGIAHSAGRPLLVLKHDDFTMPFDLAHYPYLPYSDLDRKDPIHAARSDGPTKALVAQMKFQLRPPMSLHEDPFDRKDVGPLGGERLLSRFRDLSYEDWSRIFLDATEEIWIAGISLWELIDPLNRRFFRPVDPEQRMPKNSNANISDLISYAVRRGVNVHILMMHQRNPVLKEMLLQPIDSDVDPADIFSAVCDQIDSSYRRWLQAQEKILASAAAEHRLNGGRPPGTMQVTRVLNGFISQRITLSDKEAVTSPYFDTIRFNSGGPAVRARSNRSWHKLFRAQLQLLVDHNTKDQDDAKDAFTGC